MPQLDASTYASQIIWLLITFGLIWFASQKWILPKFEDILNQREKRISDNLSEAETLRNEAKKIVEDYNSAVEKSRADASSMLAELNAELNADAQKQLDQLNAKLEEKLRVAERELEEKRKETIEELKVLAVEVTKDVISKVSQANIDQSLIETSVANALKAKGVN